VYSECTVSVQWVDGVSVQWVDSGWTVCECTVGAVCMVECHEVHLRVYDGVYGAWWMVYDVWWMVDGAWCMKCMPRMPSMLYAYSLGYYR
jgi:hypothetical protein